MAINNTAFSPNPDIVAQITGTGAQAPGYNGPSTTGAGFAPVYAATIDIAPFLQSSRFVKITSTSAIGDATITSTYVAQAGAHLVIQLNNDASSGRTTTFSTGFRPTGTVVNTASKIFLVLFISDGTTWNEVARSASAIT